MEFLIIIPILSVIIFFYIKRRSSIKKKFEEIYSKIEKVNIEIDKIVSERSDKDYYEKLCMKAYYKDNIIGSIKKKYTNISLTNLNISFNEIDKLYVELRRDLKLIDSFNRFKINFTKTKSGYRKQYNKSMKVLNELYDLYTEKDVDKYLCEFNKDYSVYKEKEISKLNSLVKKAKVDRDNYEIESLREKFTTIQKIDDNLNIKLSEPMRLKEKFEASMSNIEQLEEDISNKKGTLYFKTLNLIKTNSVTKDQTIEWNRIKRRINTFNKNRLLGKNIIKLNKSLNDIINDMMELCDGILESKEVSNFENVDK